MQKSMTIQLTATNQKERELLGFINYKLHNVSLEPMDVLRIDGGTYLSTVHPMLQKSQVSLIEDPI